MKQTTEASVQSKWLEAFMANSLPFSWGASEEQKPVHQVVRFFRGTDISKRTSLSILERKRLKSLNLIALSMLAAVTSAALTATWFEFQEATGMLVFSAVSFLGVAALLRTRYFNLAKLQLVMTLSALVFFMSCSLGSESLIQSTYLLIIPLSMFLFDRSQFLYRTLGIGFVILSFFILDFNGYDLFPSITISPAAFFLVKWGALVLALMLSGSVIRLVRATPREAVR